MLNFSSSRWTLISEECYNSVATWGISLMTLSQLQSPIKFQGGFHWWNKHKWSTSGENASTNQEEDPLTYWPVTLSRWPDPLTYCPVTLSWWHAGSAPRIWAVRGLTNNKVSVVRGRPPWNAQKASKITFSEAHWDRLVKEKKGWTMMPHNQGREAIATYYY
jgi:hypothetical protein